MKTFTNNYEAFCIEKANDQIYAGLVDGRLEVIQNYLLKKEYPFPRLPKERVSGGFIR
jgi:hypothetical protein